MLKPESVALAHRRTLVLGRHLLPRHEAFSRVSASVHPNLKAVIVESRSISHNAVGGGSLRRGTIGVFGMLVMVVAGTAPLTALSANLSLSFALGSGKGTVGVIVVVAAILVVFSVGYVAISRVVANSGAYSAYIEHGLGRWVGAGAAMIATIMYNAGAATMAAVCGYFTQIFMTTYLDLTLPWWLYAGVVIVLSGALGLIGIGVTAKVISIVCLAQFVLLLMFIGAILLDPSSHYSTEVFSPSEVFNGHAGLSIVFILLCFAGFEASAAFSEESRNSHKDVARATYLSLVVLAVIFTGATWSLVAEVQDVAAMAQADPAALVTHVMTNRLGDWVGPVLGFVVAVSFLGAALTFHNLAARYLYSTGRTGLLPVSLSRIHISSGAPHVATGVQVTISVVLIAPFAATEGDPFTSLVPAFSGLTSLGLITLMALCSLSVVLASSSGRLHGSIWATTIAPSLAALALVGAGAWTIAHYSLITGSDSMLINLMPLLLPGAALAGVLTLLKRRSPPDFSRNTH
ncbi:APC family permease [Streptomyces globisporus]|uniref:APC family permease n=1 Tax=Streptomyces globisporus TaxID=1908 RepID=UPI0037941426